MQMDMQEPVGMCGCRTQHLRFLQAGDRMGVRDLYW
jgi:hypothetical protein